MLHLKKIKMFEKSSKFIQQDKFNKSIIALKRQSKKKGISLIQKTNALKDTYIIISALKLDLSKNDNTLCLIQEYHISVVRLSIKVFFF